MVEAYNRSGKRAYREKIIQGHGRLKGGIASVQDSPLWGVLADNAPHV
jgi:hypothetical protein